MRRQSLANALFPKTRRDILAATLLRPDRWWYLSDLARHLDVSPSSLQRELAALVEAGILERKPDGNQVYYRADTACPVLSELQSIMAKTAGLSDILRNALLADKKSIDFAFAYGSIARGDYSSDSDVDLLVIGDVGLSKLAVALRSASKRIGRPVNPTVYRANEFINPDYSPLVFSMNGRTIA